MRKVIVSNLISLDGYFEGPAGEIDWFIVEEEFFEYARSIFKKTDTLLFGRKTFQNMESFWPTAENVDPTISHMMNKLPKIVFSRTLQNAGWNASKIIKENICEELYEIKKQPGKNMIIFGSGSIVSFLGQCGLIDEYRFILIPVILGKGNKMFNDISEPMKFKLKNTKKLKSGVIILSYHSEKN